MVNIVVEELNRVYQGENVYYRCKISCRCNDRTKTFYYEKVMDKDEALNFTDEELKKLFDSHPWDVRTLHFNLELNDNAGNLVELNQPEEVIDYLSREKEVNEDDEDKISGYTDVSLTSDEKELLKKLQEKKHH